MNSNTRAVIVLCHSLQDGIVNLPEEYRSTKILKHYIFSPTRLQGLIVNDNVDITETEMFRSSSGDNKRHILEVLASRDRRTKKTICFLCFNGVNYPVWWYDVDAEHGLRFNSTWSISTTAQLVYGGLVTLKIDTLTITNGRNTAWIHGEVIGAQL